MRITLNETEQRLARYLAKRRTDSNRSHGVPDGKMGAQSSELTDLEGVAAELAFCKFMNVYPDLQLDERPYADAFTRQFGAVDVKATRYRSGRLLAVRGKAGKSHPDSYALLIGEFPEYEFVGWAPASELLDDGNLTDLGHGKTYALTQDRLHKVGAIERMEA